ncbi:hypothetical protein GCM10027449_10330 [Sinomonas notoginsengisoli]
MKTTTTRQRLALALTATITADEGSFDAVVKAGTSTAFTAPAKPGSYTYNYTYHSSMTLRVK